MLMALPEQGGEIDVLEGVHDNEHNQVSWHTGPGCDITPNQNFTGTTVSLTYLLHRPQPHGL